MSIFSVWGPPNSGKTTLAIDLAYALAQRDHSVCLISNEQYGELVARLDINISEAQSLPMAYKAKGSLKQIVYKVDDLLFVLAVSSVYDAFRDESSSEGARTILEQAITMFDYIIVDCPSYTLSYLSAWALKMSQNVFCVTGNRTSSAMWYSAFKTGIEEIESKVIPVCIEVNDYFNYTLLHQLLKYDPFTWVPYYKDADMHLVKYPTLYASGGKFGRKYDHSINVICDFIEERREEVTTYE